MQLEQDPSDPRYLRTVRGKGYLLKEGQVSWEGAVKYPVALLRDKREKSHELRIPEFDAAEAGIEEGALVYLTIIAEVIGFQRKRVSINLKRLEVITTCHAARSGSTPSAEYLRNMPLWGNM